MAQLRIIFIKTKNVNNMDLIQKQNKNKAYKIDGKWKERVCVYSVGAKSSSKSAENIWKLENQ